MTKTEKQFVSEIMKRKGSVLISLRDGTTLAVTKAEHIKLKSIAMKYALPVSSLLGAGPSRQRQLSDEDRELRRARLAEARSKRWP
jgi:hypothetical protein